MTEQDSPSATDSSRFNSRSEYGLLQKARVALVLAIPLLAGFLAGARQPWARALVLGVMALAMLIVGRKQHLPRWLGAALIVLLVLGLSGFLPRSWFAVPDWRGTMEQDYGVTRALTLSPQPWVTLESWTLLIVGVTWLSFCLGVGFRESQRRMLMQGLALGITSMAVLALLMKRGPENSALMLTYADWKGYSFESQFGLFPNRNHFAGLCAVAAVLAAVMMKDAWGRKRWIVALLMASCQAPLILAASATRSRGGLLLLCVGLCWWAGTLLFRRFSWKRLALALTLVLILAAAVSLGGKNVIERLHKNAEQVDAVNSEARTHVFRDALMMTAKNPILGIGLGNFENVFPQYQTYTTAVSRFTHPESDWLWLSSETGFTGLALGMAIVGWLIWRASGKKRASASRTDRRLRQGALIGTCLIAAHGIVDTPAHQLPSALTGLLLLALAQPSGRPLDNKARSLFAFHFPSCAVIFVLAALSWSTAKLAPWWPSRSASILARVSVADLLRQNRPFEALRLVSEPIRWEPMHYQGYFQRAIGRLDLGQPPQLALADFSTARYLEPFSGPLCMAEADAWLAHDPQYAIIAWGEALRREPGMLWNYYYSMLNTMRKHEELREGIRLLASTPSLKVLYLAFSATDKEAPPLIDQVLREDPNLETLKDFEYSQFFRAWSRWGDQKALLESLARNSVWQAKGGWILLAEDMVNHGNAKGAVELGLQYLKAPPTRELRGGGDPESLRRALLRNPDDVKTAWDLFDSERRADKKAEALTALEHIEKITKDTSSNRLVYFEEAMLQYELKNYPAAWQKLHSFGGW